MPAKNLNELFNYIQKEMLDSTKNDVSPTVKKAEKEAIQSTVFKAYKDPFYYERRPSGGIDDVTNMVDDIQIVGDKIILSITNIAKGKNEPNFYIAPLIEYGDDNGYGEYQYKFNRAGTQYNFLKPRPFTEETIKTLEITGEHKKALLESLKKKGWNIK